MSEPNGQVFGLRKLGLNMVATSSRQLSIMVLGFLLSALLANILGPEGNGIYALVVLLATLLSTFLNLGFPVANIYFLGRGDVSVRQAYRATVRIWVLISIVGLVIATAVIHIGGDILFQGVPEVYLWAGTAIFPVILLQTLLLSLLQGMQDFSRYTWASLVSFAITLALTVITVWALPGGTAGAVLALALGQLAGLFITWKLTSKYLKTPATQQSSDYTRQALHYGWRAYISNVITFLNYRADLLLVAFFLNTSATGIYVIAVQIAERLWALSQAVSIVLLPRLSELHQDETARRSLTALVSRWVLLLTLVLTGVVGFAAPPLITLIFGQEYIGAIEAFLWLLPGIVFLSFGRVLANDIAARGKPELNTVVAGATFAVNVVANVVLIPAMGINGASLASTLSYGVTAATELYLHARLSGNPWWRPIVLTREDWLLVKRGYAILRARP